MDRDTIRAKNKEFAEVLRPLARIVAEVGCDDPGAAVATLSEQAALDSELIRGIRAAAERAAAEGWLVYRGEPGLQFGRVAKDLEGFTVDAVLMDRPGPRHRHPNGEYDLCFSTRGDARFDGNPEGWTVYEPGSVHVPTVTGGEMLILYFLPGGAFELVD